MSLLRTFHGSEIHLLLAAPMYFTRMIGMQEARRGQFVGHLNKKLLLPGLLDAMLYELEMQDPQRNDC
ncbi:hypothetical protein LEMLEM_LOCUS23561 [Lemmus lemmus]